MLTQLQNFFVERLVPNILKAWCILNGGHHKEWRGGVHGYIHCIRCPYRTSGFKHM